MADFASLLQQGNACYERHDLVAAGEHYRRAIALQPTSIDANYNLGVVLADRGLIDEASAQFRGVLELNPSCAPAWNFLGICDAAQQRDGDAEKHYRRAIELQYQFPHAHFNLGQLLLRMGRLEEGFAESEWRWQTPQFTPLNCMQPRWNGDEFDGTLLVHTEQGAGDAMQFIRYIPIVAPRCRRVMLVCTENLEPLFRSVPGIDQIRGAGEIENHEFQAWIPLMSLPHVLGTTMDSIPCDVPYLSPPADRAPIDLGAPHVSDARLRVGISWAGSPTHQNDRHRSCSLTEFAPILDVADVAFYSLQVGPKADELSQLDDHAELVRDLRPLQRDFSDAALIMRQLDLVISVDTAVLHLASALGCPTWGLLSKRFDWRWLNDRQDSPWYPTLRLFRQSELDDWPELMQRVAAELSDA
jgi:hypothetical protein